jgi:orotate phosphoribosyltransferase
MQKYKEEFIEFLVRSNALKFGDFTLKSGRRCPYFLNMGSFSRGSQISELGKYYAEALNNNIKDYDVVFGPAFKGIPLCVATTAQTFKLFNKDVEFSYNRKVAKDHGEGGLLVGAPVTAESRVVIVDDVMTAGTAVREVLDLLSKAGNPKIAGVLIAVDRMEKGQGEKSAIQEMKDEVGIQVYSIVTIAEIVEYLFRREIDGKIYMDDNKMQLIENYRKQYGI